MADAATADTGTLRRGLAVLRALERSGHGGLRIAEIARETAVPRPTVYRLIETLVEWEFAREAAEGRYVAVARKPVGAVNNKWVMLARRLATPMRKIAAATGDSVFLIRRDAQDAVCLHREFGTFPIQVHSIKIGGRQPLGVGAAGLALLASYPDAEVDAILARNRDKLVHYGGLTERKFRLLIASTRTRGYSVVANHAVAGILGVGIVILDRCGTSIAGLSSSTTVERMPAARQRQLAAMMRAAVDAR